MTGGRPRETWAGLLGVVIAAVVLVLTYLGLANAAHWVPFRESSRADPKAPYDRPIERNTIATVVVRTWGDCQTSDDVKRCWVGVWSIPAQNSPPMITRVKHGTVLDVLCYRTGEEIANGAGDANGDPIPGVTVSDVWFYVKTGGKEGYIPKVWTVAQVGPVDRQCTFK